MRRVRQGGPTPLVAGLITLVVAVVAVYLGFTKSNPFADPFELRAAFQDAGNVKKGAPVRIAGVQVGKVTAVESAEDGSRGATVVMSVDDKGLPIHRDAKIKVRPRIFLEGNYFVEVEPGSPSVAEVEDGGTLPITQTAAPVSFGQVLDTFQRDTREDLRLLLQELGEGYSDGGARAYGRAVRWWDRAFTGSALVNEATLGQRPGDLSGYIAGAGKVARALDRDPEALKGLVTDLATTADALADQEQRLQSGIGQLDETLIQGRRTFGVLNDALPPLRRLVAEMRPAARAARPALQAQLPFVRQLRGLVGDAELRGLARDLGPVVPDLAEMAEGGVPLQEQARQLGSCQLEVVLPTTGATIEDPFIPAEGKVYQEGVRWLPGIAGESRSFDGNGQYIKTLGQTVNYAYLIGNGRFFGTTIPLQGVNPPPNQTLPPLEGDAPCETQAAPDLRTEPGDPPPAIKVNHSSKEALARSEKATQRTVRWLRGQLGREGLSRRFRVTAKPLTEADLGKVVKRVVGRGG